MQNVEYICSYETLTKDIRNFIQKHLYPSVSGIDTVKIKLNTVLCTTDI